MLPQRVTTQEIVNTYELRGPQTDDGAAEAGREVQKRLRREGMANSTIDGKPQRGAVTQTR